MECGHLSSVSHVPAIACAFALRECISLVSQPFSAQLYLSSCPAMWFPEYVWGSACETHSTFSLGVHALSKTHFRKAECWLQRLYIHWLWYDLKACCWTIHVLRAWRVSWQPSQFAYWVHCQWRGCIWWLTQGTQTHELLLVCSCGWCFLNVLPHELR